MFAPALSFKKCRFKFYINITVKRLTALSKSVLLSVYVCCVQSSQCFLTELCGYVQDDEEDVSDEDSDDDDTAALLAELEKIKKERAEEQERKVGYSPPG